MECKPEILEGPPNVLIFDGVIEAAASQCSPESLRDSDTVFLKENGMPLVRRKRDRDRAVQKLEILKEKACESRCCTL